MRRFILAIALLCILPLASAEVIFSQPHTTYNRGDNLQLSATVSSQTAMTGSVTIILVCANGGRSLYQQPLTLEANGQRNIAIDVPLVSSVIGDLHDVCLLRGNYGGATSESQNFIISNIIVVETALDGSLIDPAQALHITGTARKSNGNPVINGIVTISLDAANASLTTHISNGAFNITLVTPDTIAAGEHIVTTRIVERDADNVMLNEGSASDSFSVRSLLKMLVFDVDNATIQPGVAVPFVVYAGDQSGTELATEAVLTIYTPSGDSVSSRIVQTNGEETFTTELTTAPGYWKLEAKIGTLVAKKLIYVSELEDATFIMENETLVITNTGNVPYERAIQISINNITEIREISLPVGTTKRFRLRAPDASYDVSVSDGVRSSSIPGVFLTGRAIDIGEVSSGGFSYKFISIFLIGILVLGLVANFFVQRRRSGRFRDEAVTPFKPMKKAVFSSDPASAASDAFTTGSKHEASVVAVRFDPGNKTISKQVESALDAHRSNATSIYAQGNHWIMVFDKERAGATHGLMALKTAKALEQALKDTVDTKAFGIGVNRGEALVDSRAKDRIMGFGSLIPVAKKLATQSQGEVLASEPLYRSLVSSVRAEKLGEQNAWRIKHVIDRDSHGSFLQGFLRRQDK